MENDAQDRLLQRLRTAEGHLKAVMAMAETGQPCEQVLHQLHAVQSALRMTQLMLIHCQVQESRNIILQSPSLAERTAEVRKIQALFRIFTR